MSKFKKIKEQKNLLKKTLNLIEKEIWFTFFILLIGKTSSALNSDNLKNIIQGLTGTIFIYFSYKILSVESSK